MHHHHHRCHHLCVFVGSVVTVISVDGDVISSAADIISRVHIYAATEKES